jgi:hypothetical protein
MATRRGKKSKRTGGRRANYAPTVDQVGVNKYLPIGWANWLGFVMFGLITIFLFAETINATVEHRGADPIAAGIMTVVFAIMTYLFGTTRVKDV